MHNGCGRSACGRYIGMGANIRHGKWTGYSFVATASAIADGAVVIAVIFAVILWRQLYRDLCTITEDIFWQSGIFNNWFT